MQCVIMYSPKYARLSANCPSGRKAIPARMMPLFRRPSPPRLPLPLLLCSVHMQMTSLSPSSIWALFPRAIHKVATFGQKGVGQFGDIGSANGAEGRGNGLGRAGWEDRAQSPKNSRKHVQFSACEVVARNISKSPFVFLSSTRSE